MSTGGSSESYNGSPNPQVFKSKKPPSKPENRIPKVYKDSTLHVKLSKLHAKFKSFVFLIITHLYLRDIEKNKIVLNF